MKVSKLECLPVHAGWRKNFVFVRVETDSGIVGWGEAYSQYDRDRAIAAQVEELGRYVVGRDPFHIRHILQIAFDDYAQRRGSLELFCATSGIEQALWDIIGKATGQPVYNLLGGPVRSRVRVYANGWTRARGLRARRRGRPRSRLHGHEGRSGAGSVADLYPQGAHQTRR
jgi:galactonate dehydratase